MWRGGLLESEYLSAFMFPKFRLDTAGHRFMRELNYSNRSFYPFLNLNTKLRLSYDRVDVGRKNLPTLESSWAYLRNGRTLIFASYSYSLIYLLYILI